MSLGWGTVAEDTQGHGQLRCGPGPRGAALPPPFPGGPHGPRSLSPENPLEPVWDTGQRRPAGTAVVSRSPAVPPALGAGSRGHGWLP